MRKVLFISTIALLAAVCSNAAPPKKPGQASARAASGAKGSANTNTKAARAASARAASTARASSRSARAAAEETRARGAAETAKKSAAEIKVEDAKQEAKDKVELEALNDTLKQRQTELAEVQNTLKQRQATIKTMQDKYDNLSATDRAAGEARLAEAKTAAEAAKTAAQEEITTAQAAKTAAETNLATQKANEKTAADATAAKLAKEQCIAKNGYMDAESICRVCPTGQAPKSTSNGCEDTQATKDAAVAAIAAKCTAKGMVVADDNGHKGQCRSKHPYVAVSYAANCKSTIRFYEANGQQVPCNNTNFSDPNHGRRKSCYIGNDMRHCSLKMSEHVQASVQEDQTLTMPTITSIPATYGSFVLGQDADKDVGDNAGKGHEIYWKYEAP
ncbi:MAG: hypothetical protein LBL52_00535 [Rickettsiales bacterium]|jgi:hypothetical protein|nr:hypothetical protein [Rickettsiales bacterium]